ncbi:MAG: hypothetical protein H7Y31_14590 [Chitinophagaceae bacterium]|nr:hypothetical protein [Chitinophagaceae bacterium]
MREQIRERRREMGGGCFRKGRGNVGAGIVILLIGACLLLREMGIYFPTWFFKWPMIVIAVGIFIGVTNRFRDFAWLLIVGVGFFFLADDIWPQITFRNYLFPMIFIAIGLFILLRPSSRIFKGTTESDPLPIDDPTNNPTGEPVYADALDVTAVFGAVRKSVVSKNFRGGEIVSVFGGADINLSQADFKGSQIVIESVNIFGGTKLIVPGNWQIRSEAVAIFGGIEDKRSQIATSEPEKILILQGFVMFGGIEIKSY